MSNSNTGFAGDVIFTAVYILDGCNTAREYVVSLDLPAASDFRDIEAAIEQIARQRAGETREGSEDLGGDRFDEVIAWAHMPIPCGRCNACTIGNAHRCDRCRRPAGWYLPKRW